MHPTTALEELGGIATLRQLRTMCARGDLARCLAGGDVIRSTRGRYTLPTTESSLAIAHELTAVVSHSSAALLWGWEVRLPPPIPHVTVRRNRKVTPGMRAKAQLHFADLGEDDVTNGRTGRRRTLIDCLAGLPQDDALAVADSALRHGDITHTALVALAEQIRGPGATRARFVAKHASALAANPFESALRSISLEVPGLDLRPQVNLFGLRGFLGRPDLTNTDLFVIVEAESHSFHSRRGDLRADCQRYTCFVVEGWLVIRFAWEDVIHERAYVRRELQALLALAVKQAMLRDQGSSAA